MYKYSEKTIDGQLLGVWNKEGNRANWIREQLKSGQLKGKPILYYKELGEPSHATALDYLINKYNWNKNQPTEIKPKIDSSKKIENLKRGDIINFQQQEFLVERVRNEGIDVRDVNTGDVDFISIEDYIDETQEQSIVEENVTDNQNTQDKEIEFTPEDLGLNTDSNQNDAVCK